MPGDRAVASSPSVATEQEQSLLPMGSMPLMTPQRGRSPLFEYSCSRSSSSISPRTSPSHPGAAAVTIDYIVFPHVFDVILRHCDSDALMRLQGTCRAVRAIVDPWLYRHVEVFVADDDLSLDVYSRGSKPRLRSTMTNPAGFSHTQAIDLYGDLPQDAFGRFAKLLKNIETVRLVPDGLGRCVDKCPVRTKNLVIVGEPKMPKTDPGADWVVMKSLLKRVIVHIQGLDDTNGLWYHQLLYPYGTREIVFVFTDWKKPFTPIAASRGRSA